MFSNTENNKCIFCNSNFLFSWKEALPNEWEPAFKSEVSFCWVMSWIHSALTIKWVAGPLSICSPICVAGMLPQGPSALGNAGAVWNFSSIRLSSGAPGQEWKKEHGFLGFSFVTLVLFLLSSPPSSTHMHHSDQIETAGQCPLCDHFMVSCTYVKSGQWLFCLKKNLPPGNL
jgi:hypothetical protein